MRFQLASGGAFTGVRPHANADVRTYIDLVGFIASEYIRRWRRYQIEIAHFLFLALDVMLAPYMSRNFMPAAFPTSAVS